jgi:hypothetical protein
VLVREGIAGFYNPTWFNVVAVARNGRRVLCRCRTCGHEYTTASTAAHRAMDSAERFATVCGPRHADLYVRTSYRGYGLETYLNNPTMCMVVRWGREHFVAFSWDAARDFIDAVVDG